MQYIIQVSRAESRRKQTLTLRDLYVSSPRSIKRSIHGGGRYIPQTFHQSFHRGGEAADPSPSHPSMAADPPTTDIPQTIQGSLPVVDYLRLPVDYNAWSAATGDQENPPRLPLICTLSYDGTTLIAIDCFSKTGDTRAHRIHLPAHLHGHKLFSSISHCLLLEKRGSPSGIRLFNPFLSPPFSTQAACLPPSFSVKPRPNSQPEEEEKVYPTPESYTYYKIHTVVPDTERGIALALMGHRDFRLAYTMLDGSGVGSHWFDLTELVVTDEYTYFQSAVLYKGLFCAVDGTANGVISLDISRDSVEHSDITFDLQQNYLPIENVEANWCTYQSASLINSGSLLYLVRWRNKVNEYGVKPKREIDVFLFDDSSDSSKSWVQVNSLNHHSFFIGQNVSFSISTVDFPELNSNQVFICRDAVIPIDGNELARPYDTDNIDEYGFHLLHNLDDGEGEWSVYYRDRKENIHPADFFMWMLPPAGRMA